MFPSKLFIVCALCSLPAVRCVERSCDCSNEVMDCVNRGKVNLRSDDICRGAKRVLLFSNMFRTFPDGLSGTNFVEVNITSNVLTSLPSATDLSRRIRVLDLSSNDIQVTSAEFRSLSSLEVLNISDNIVSSIEFLPDPCNLKTFEASGNILSNLAGPLRKCNKLQLLNIGSNRFNVLGNSEFLGLMRLKSLDLSYNPLRELAPLTFQGLEQLEVLLLHECDLLTLPSSIFSGLRNLKRLDLSSNRLNILPESIFNGLSALEQLRMDKNQIHSISPSLFTGPRNLLFLSVSFNNVTSILSGTFSGLTQLQHINLNGNQISEIHSSAFLNLPSLKILLLDANRLTSLPDVIDCCGALEEASFDHNNVSQPGRTTMQRFLATRSLRASLKYNPISAPALRWLVAEVGLQLTVDADDCACGAVHRGAAEVELCVEVQCGGGNRFANWLSAVRAHAG